ncbi:MAG: hypothetical protein IIB00_08860 [candidate division Zixibacteria bacterium]|nr:hypothetical protein [candidate division Zixibacteria bacterium]
MRVVFRSGAPTFARRGDFHFFEVKISVEADKLKALRFNELHQNGAIDLKYIQDTILIVSAQAVLGGGVLEGIVVAHISGGVARTFVRVSITVTDKEV